MALLVCILRNRELKEEPHVAAVAAVAAAAAVDDGGGGESDCEDVGRHHC